MLTDKQVELINDLRIQAMIFDMDIDWETLSLVEKSKYKEETWLTNWKDKRDASDNLPESPEQADWSDIDE